MATESKPEIRFTTLEATPINGMPGWRFTIDGLGHVDFPQRELPSSEEQAGARLGLLHNAGRLTYELAVRTAAGIDQEWKERQPRKLGVRTPAVVTPATTTLARVIGGIPPQGKS